MHLGTSMKGWSHRLHDGMLGIWHHIDQHLHSRHFWTGVGVAVLIMGFVMLAIMLARETPVILRGEYPYGIPYSPYQY
ncbi:MAG: hypothetical protein KJN67_01260 [Pontiella sp.]|nr:hypothetical protein [Pontiella sp.]